MTEKKRVILNIVATYGRSLYAMAVGLFTCRWALAALGHVDYGLLGVVGGMIAFVTFFNSLLGDSVGRFYAFAIGQAKVAHDKFAGLEECRKWFSIALSMHLVLPIVLLSIGYPVGIWMVENWLTIPLDRVAACVWVWRFSCFSCFFGMVNVPFGAMYSTKLEIAELTIYSFVSSTLKFGFVYYMVSHPGDWLVGYAAALCFLGVVPPIIIGVRAIFKYPECRFRMTALRETDRFAQLFSYVGCRFFTLFSQLITSQGMTLLVNKLLGPARNAAMTIGVSITNHSMTLQACVDGSIAPVITRAAGANEMDRVRHLAYRTSVLTVLSVAVFSLPLLLEVDEVMRLWLGNPPEQSAQLCRLLLVAFMIDKPTIGHVRAIFGKGRIAMFQIGEGVVWIVALIVAWVLMSMGCDISSVGYGWIFMYVLDDIFKLICGRILCGLSVRRWFGQVLSPMLFVCAATLLVGSIPVFLMEQSFSRLLLTTAACEFVFIPLAWFFVLVQNERQMILSKLRWQRKR